MFGFLAMLVLLALAMKRGHKTNHIVLMVLVYSLSTPMLWSPLFLLAVSCRGALPGRLSSRPGRARGLPHEPSRQCRPRLHHFRAATGRRHLQLLDQADPVCDVVASAEHRLLMPKRTLGAALPAAWSDGPATWRAHAPAQLRRYVGSRCLSTPNWLTLPATECPQ
jgi:hypothetical protein